MHFRPAAEAERGIGLAVMRCGRGKGVPRHSCRVGTFMYRHFSLLARNLPWADLVLSLDFSWRSIEMAPMTATRAEAARNGAALGVAVVSLGLLGLWLLLP